MCLARRGHEKLRFTNRKLLIKPRKGVLTAACFKVFLNTAPDGGHFKKFYQSFSIRKTELPFDFFININVLECIFTSKINVFQLFLWSKSPKISP